MVVMAAHHTHGLDAVITRGSNTYGPYQHPEKVIPHFTTRLLRGECAPLYGDGMNVREWLHVDDHVAGVMAALEHGEAGRVYHLGGQPLTNAMVTLAVLQTLGLPWDRVCPVEDRKGHDRRYSLDTTRAARELGFTPRHEAVPGIVETVRWYVDHPEWWEPIVDRA
jgi:dTDP-glucose 4,6-dehydratase